MLLDLAIGELESAIVRELSLQIDLKRLQEMQDTLTKLQRSLIFHTANSESPWTIDCTARSFAVWDPFLAYSAITVVRKLVKCPTYEESGLEQGLWTAQEKLRFLKRESLSFEEGDGSRYCNI